MSAILGLSRADADSVTRSAHAAHARCKSIGIEAKVQRQLQALQCREDRAHRRWKHRRVRLQVELEKTALYSITLHFLDCAHG